MIILKDPLLFIRLKTVAYADRPAPRATNVPVGPGAPLAAAALAAVPAVRVAPARRQEARPEVSL